MNWFNIVLVLVLALSIISTILDIGKPRKPITPGLAVAVLIVEGLLILGVVIYR